jgi:hypothetical protein
MKQLTFLCFLILSATSLLHADGGRIRLHQQAGPFIVTLFTTPEPLQAGPADFSVAVEKAGAPGLLTDADVTLILTRLDDPDAARIVLPATHQNATSRFLQAANFNIPQGGLWRVRVLVARNGEAAECSTHINILPATPLTSPLLAPLLALPLCILLFLLHQWRKKRAAASVRTGSIS